MQDDFDDRFEEKPMLYDIFNSSTYVILNDGSILIQHAVNCENCGLTCIGHFKASVVTENSILAPCIRCTKYTVKIITFSLLQ